MNIKRERHACAAQFVHTVHRLQTAGHADFEHVLSKRTNVADNIHIAGLAILQLDDFITLLCHCTQLALQLLDTCLQELRLFIIRRLHLLCQLADLVVILAFFLLNLFALALQLAALFRFLPHLFTDSTLLLTGALFLNIVFILDFNSFLKIIIQLTNKLLDSGSNTLVAIRCDHIIFVSDRFDIVQCIIQFAKTDIIQHILQLCRQRNDHQSVDRDVSFCCITILVFFKGRLNTLFVFSIPLPQFLHVQTLEREGHGRLHQGVCILQQVIHRRQLVLSTKDFTCVLDGLDQFLAAAHLLLGVFSTLAALFFFLGELVKMIFTLKNPLFKLKFRGCQLCIFRSGLCRSICTSFRRDFVKQSLLVRQLRI